VGYELYTQMLEEAANEYKGEIKETTFDTIVDFKHNLFIPDTYINSPKEKISAYKIIMRAQTQEDIDSNKEYIADKYGKMPEELIDLFEVASLKTVLKRVRVLSVIEGNYNIYLKLDEYSNIDAQKVLSLIKSPRSGIYLDNNNFNQLIVPVVEDNLNWKINKIREILLQIESEPKVIKKEIELEDNIEVENKDKTSKKTKEVSMLDINLKQLSNKKTGKRRPAKTIIKKRNNF
jgi:transcription-repair coupling factor (superfamily II helicase)